MDWIRKWTNRVLESLPDDEWNRLLEPTLAPFRLDVWLEWCIANDDDGESRFRSMAWLDPLPEQVTPDIVMASVLLSEAMWSGSPDRFMRAVVEKRPFLP